MPGHGDAVTATGVAHCGLAARSGDIIAEFAVLGLSASVAGLTLGAEFIGDYLAALVLGIMFQVLRDRPDARAVPA